MDIPTHDDLTRDPEGRANGATPPHGLNGGKPSAESDRRKPLSKRDRQQLNDLGQKILDWYYDNTVKEFKSLNAFKRMEKIWDCALAFAGKIAAKDPRAGREIHVLMVLARLSANPDGYCYAGINFITSIVFGTLEPTVSQKRCVQYALSSLRARGGIFEREYPGKPTHRVPRLIDRIDHPGRHKSAVDPCGSDAPLEHKEIDDPCSPSAPPRAARTHPTRAARTHPIEGIIEGFKKGRG